MLLKSRSPSLAPLPSATMVSSAAKRQGRPRGSQAHQALRMEARVVAEAVGAAGADDVGARLQEARACKKSAKLSKAAQASSVAALEPRDEEALRAVWSGAKMGHNVKTYAVEKATFLTSAAVQANYWAQFNSLLKSVDQDIQERTARGIMFALTRTYDETPQKLKVACVPGNSVATARALDMRFSRVTSADTLCPAHITDASSVAATFPGPASAAAIVQSRQTAKVMVHFRGFAMLLAYKQDDGTDLYAHIYGKLPSTLKAMNAQTKEVVFALLQHFRALSPTAMQIVERNFPRRYVLSTADSHPSNMASERADQFIHKGWQHTYIQCEIHRCDTCETRTTELVPETVSGLVNLGVFFGRKGHDLIVAFQEWIERAPLHVYQGRPLHTLRLQGRS